jgi:tetratricopeptide (TPR) repeat protein
MNDFTMAIKLDPKFPHAYLSRGELFSKLGQREAAIKDLKTAVGIFKGLNDQKGYQLSLEALKWASR